MCLVLAGGVGCKASSSGGGEPVVPASASQAAGVAAGSAQSKQTITPALRGKVSLRSNGEFAVSSPDGTQVILLKVEGTTGHEVGMYRVCDATGATLSCGPWQRMDTECTQCLLEPCPCSNPVCTPVCKPL